MRLTDGGNASTRCNVADVMTDAGRHDAGCRMRIARQSMSGASHEVPNDIQALVIAIQHVDVAALRHSLLPEPLQQQQSACSIHISLRIAFSVQIPAVITQASELSTCMNFHFDQALTQFARAIIPLACVPVAGPTRYRITHQSPDLHGRVYRLAELWSCCRHTMPVPDRFVEVRLLAPGR